MTAHSRPEPSSELARQVWLRMSNLVLDQERRRAVTDKLGMSFGRARALRRVALRPMLMSELATALGIDRPNATTLVDSLEERGLVRRRPHPTDRRAKLVEATPKGQKLARQAEEILGTPPPVLSALDLEDLKTLNGFLERITGQQATSNPTRRLQTAEPGRRRGRPGPAASS